jgi:hypothetical protein
MHKIIVIAVMAFALAGCQTYQQQRAGTGALIGGGTGAVIGGLVGGSGSSALAGGLIGAAAGGVIGAATTPKKCYVRSPSGKLHRVRC